MLLIGLAFFVYWLLIAVFSLAVDKSALVVAIIFIVLGLLLEQGNLLARFRNPQ